MVLRHSLCIFLVQQILKLISSINKLTHLSQNVTRLKLFKAKTTLVVQTLKINVLVVV
jgi:hypothetical protein